MLKNTPPHIGFQQSPPVIVQTGGQLDSRSVNSSGSGAVVQANSAVVQTLTYQGDVVISNSYNDRKNQIEDLSQLIKLIRNESDSGSQEAAQELEKVKEELEQEQTPDPARIERWLGKASKALDTAKKSKQVFDKARDVYRSFNVPSLIESLGGFLG